MEVNCLEDLNKFRTAPSLNLNQIKKLVKELDSNLCKSDWITIGIMASNDHEAIKAFKSIVKRYSFLCFQEFEELKASGNVFLKGNQKTGNVFIRSENCLGEGILLTCQYDKEFSGSSTYGPFPLNFFLVNY